MRFTLKSFIALVNVKACKLENAAAVNCVCVSLLISCSNLLNASLLSREQRERFPLVFITIQII